MIVRAWRGYAPLVTADAYSRHLLGTVRPQLERLPGFRGLYLLSRRLPNEVEYQVLTMWESMDAIRAFAGEQIGRASCRERVEISGVGVSGKKKERRRVYV